MIQNPVLDPWPANAWVGQTQLVRQVIEMPLNTEEKNLIINSIYELWQRGDE